MMSFIKFMYNVLLTSVIVNVFLISDGACEFFRGPELSVSQNFQSKNVSEWPVVGQRRQNVVIVNPNPISNNRLSSGPFTNYSVANSVKLWNSYYENSNVNKANANKDVRPIKFDDDDVVGNVPNPSKRFDSSQVTDDELRTFSEKLFEKTNQSPASYISVNFQGRTTSRSKNDEAPLPLMRIRKEVYDITTISKLQPLYDNYVVKADVNEDYTQGKKQEENTFLKAILETDVMEETRQFLIRKNRISDNRRDFENLMRDIWFNHYSRGKRKVGSSGFEHVFLAEIKKSDVSGLHNWLYFEKEESNNRANYLGYLKKLDLGNNRFLLKFNFDFHGINKPVGSMFIGTCPEFEMALYSACFLLRADKICPMKLNGKRFVIRTYTFNYDGKDLIGSAFPEI